MPVVDVIDGSDHRGVVPMAQVIDIQRMADLPDAVFHIQAQSRTVHGGSPLLLPRIRCVP